MKAKRIIVHHSLVDYDKNNNQLDAINNYHKSLWNNRSSLGYYVGYHYLINRNGTITKIRKLTERGIHTKGENHDSIGICVEGNFDIQKPQPAQNFKLRDLLRELVIKLNLTTENIHTHNEYSEKTCPGKNLSLDFIRSLVEKRVEKTLKEKIILEFRELEKLINQL